LRELTLPAAVPIGWFRRICSEFAWNSTWGFHYINNQVATAPTFGAGDLKINVGWNFEK
jgi:hypothetical protein